MSSSRVNLAPLVIASGAAISRWVSSDLEYGDSIALVLRAPATLDAHTYIIETTQDATVASPVVQAFQQGDPLADCAPPAAGKARVYYDLGILAYFRIKDTSGNAAATRTFLCEKLIGINR